MKENDLFVESLALEAQKRAQENGTDLIRPASRDAVGLRHGWTVPAVSLRPTLGFFIHTFSARFRRECARANERRGWGEEKKKKEHPPFGQAWLMPELFSPHFIWWSSVSSPPLSIIRHGSSLSLPLAHPPLHPILFLSLSLCLAQSPSPIHCLALPPFLLFSLFLLYFNPPPPLVSTLRGGEKKKKREKPQSRSIVSCLYLHHEWSRCHSSTLVAYWVLGKLLA